ncbi:growth/differentiatio [Scyliorhinus torazame]|uniref:growth/differentiatio n=1 Tax=Scyliorhinus torazame TaxID=75743 RepID=UPI003B5A18CD
MKILYTMSATQDGIPKRPADHRYNTVRLLTPRIESRDTEEVFEQYVFYGLDPVTSREQLLRSVLLYSVDKAAYSSLRCEGEVTVREARPLPAQTCSSAGPSLTFHLRLERRRPRRWLEVDLASFLQPFLGPGRGGLRLGFTYRCGRRWGLGAGAGVRAPLPQAALPAPSLLLFLNETLAEPARRSWLPPQAGGPVRRRRRRRPQGEPSAAGPGRFPHLQYPDHECRLHDLRLSFSQLRWERWIIAPHDYNPHYCRGGCPRALSHRYGSPIHTLIQNILYEKVDSSIPRPSCVPSQYNPLSVLTLENDGSIVYKEYKDMIATTCTCR